MEYILIGVIVVLITVFFIVWIISVQRRLAGMEENANNAMCQIGVQLAARFDVVSALMILTKGYADIQSQTLIETGMSRRSIITAGSAPEEVLKQERILSETLGYISMVAERNPELKTNENYAKCMNAADGYEKMVRTSCLIYNDSVTRLNHELRIFPTSLIAGIFGFRQRDYVEIEEP